MALTPNDYATKTEFKAELIDTTWGVGYDAFIDLLLPAASRLIDRFLGRAPGDFKVTADETRYFTGSGVSELWIDEIAVAPTSVAMDLVGDQVTYTLLDAANYQEWPRNAAQKGIPFYRLDIPVLTNPTYYTWYSTPDSIKVIGKWGYSVAIPNLIKRATLIQTVRWFKRAQQAYQDVGAITSLGQLTYVQKLDPDMENIINLDFGRLAI